jgi:hypothetical protein
MSKKNFLLTLLGVAILFFAMEFTAGLILKKVDPNYDKPQNFNRQLSGLTIFQNTPLFVNQTFKDNADYPDIKQDSFGFITDAPVSMTKDSNTYRVFLLSRSAMVGAGQYELFAQYKKFPSEIYAYQISIAWYLKKSFNKNIRTKT